MDRQNDTDMTYKEFIHSIKKSFSTSPDRRGHHFYEHGLERITFYANVHVAERRMKEHEQYGWKCGVLYRNGNMEMVECTRTYEEMRAHARP